MENVDVIILANNVNDYHYSLTKKTIDTLLDTKYDVKFNIIIIESNTDSEYVFENCLLVKPNKKFNYAEFTNLGYSMCESEWIMVCNNDLSFEPTWFEEIMKVYKLNPNIKSFSSFEPNFHNQYYSSFYNENDNLYFGYHVPSVLTGWCYLHRKSVLDLIGGCDEQFDFYFVDNDYGKMLEYYEIPHCLVKSSIVHHVTSASHDTIPDMVTTEAGAAARKKFDDKWTNLVGKPYNYNRYTKKNKTMRICQINPGILPIPPNGWGAVEKIIWEYKQEIEKQGHVCDIKYLNEVQKGDYDIVHVHMGNLALELANRGIPYIFSLHDHHVVHFGKDSNVFKHNLEAIKKSVISFTHAEYLVDYFDDTDKLFYLSHGVNNQYFQPSEKYRKEIKLLCLANNGIGGNSTHDRKGFRFAIEAAQKLNLPITVAGPDNNMNFFNANPDLMEYSKLTILNDNPNEESVRNLYQTHTIFLHPSNLEAGHPNLTLLESMACGLPVVGTYSGSLELDGMFVTQRDSNLIAKGIQTIILDYRNFVDKSLKTAEKFSWGNIVNKMLQIYDSVTLINKEYDSQETKRLYVDSINNTKQNIIPYKERSVSPHLHFVNQPQLYLNGDYDKELRVEFYDENNVCHYGAPSKCGMWIALNRRYFTKWRARVLDGYDLLWEEQFNASEKRVFVTFDSKSLGDTLAWIPQVERFRQKHNCELVCSTFHNELLKSQYPNITFVDPGSVVDNIYALYSLGIFYNSDGSVDYNKHKNNPREIPLIQVASDILGLEFEEVKPNLPLYGIEKKKQVSIAIHSTAQAKYWNNPTGWQEVVDYVKLKGYEVVLLSREHDGYMGNFNPQGIVQHPEGPTEDILQTIQESELFIGLSSGLSWLAWGTDTPTVIISGFTDDSLEPKIGIDRIINKSVCHGCWGRHRFNPGDWYWCPDYKDTPRQFECTKTITSEMVIDVIKKYL